ncbi:MAG TPA: S8 family serine peptidase, partial [Gaiellaceae bacterium]|nr:S8 family serine peptidase [Gaiellaceae bacterium]
MRRFPVFIALIAALVLTASASAALQPINRDFGERTIPRVRPGTIDVPPTRGRSRVRVIVGLSLPPLALEKGPGLFGSLSSSRLDVNSRSSRAYLARIEAAQVAAVRAIRAAIPSARVTRRFQVVLNGITVELPAERLPRLSALPFVTEVFPSLQYRLALNRSPSLIAAPAFTAATGITGAGIKIGIVDDGVDQQNPFFNPAGYAYPPGFPKGQRSFTTAKVIAARGYPGPGSGPRGRLPLDRLVSFHGTHVAGIAAGNSGTTSPGGRDHPPTAGLSGIAPQAWIANYRVFNIPSPIGHLANTPEIVAAFEAAVRDGMDVINFSGGGPATEPRTDALIRTVANTANAGVVPVISAGNDRDEFGLGTAGSPGTAPEAITVAATSNSHVYAPVLAVRDAAAPATVKQIPFEAPGGTVPSSWGTSDRTLVDVASLAGTNGQPVDSRVCGIGRDPNAGRNPLPRGSLAGAIALISRGRCTFVSKVIRLLQAGASGVVIIDNREGEANPIPLQLPIPAGMIPNLDGGNLRSYLATHGGRAAIRVGPGVSEILTGRSAIITSFSSAGPAPFGHILKPDVAAPGGEILSASLPNFTGGARFVSIDGTSMSSPHVAGAAALLRQRHRDWSVRQLKSALMSTAGPAWGNTARTQEASVLLEGAGFINILAADDPKVFTEPSSLSFGDVQLGTGTVSKQLLLTVRDAGGGAGAWTVELRPQTASPGIVIDVPPLVTIGPGSMASIPVTVIGGPSAGAGDNVGYLVLRRGAVTRRVPYAAFAVRPALLSAKVGRLRRVQRGSTRRGRSLTDVYRFPTSPFGHAPDYGVGPPMQEDGAERLFEIRLRKRVMNFGVAVVTSSAGARIDPFVLGAKDENTVQGHVGTPTNINSITGGYRLPIGAAGAQFALPGRYYVSVDSGRDQFTGRRHAGTWRLRSWTNDLRRPSIRVLTKRISAGRPTIALQVLDRGSGVDPFSLVFGYRRVVVGAAAYDPFTGVAIFPLPQAAPRIGVGRLRAAFLASDYQEAKNANSYGGDILPNTRVIRPALRVVRGATITWLTPLARRCAAARVELLVSAGATRRIRAVRFYDGARRLRVVRRGVAGLYAT